MEHPPSKSWSIHTRREITAKYEILERVGSGAYSDVYRARRLSDSATVALKEVHDYQSAFREIEALQTLLNSPNVVFLHEYFWSEDEDAILVLEYLPTDLSAVINAAKKEWDGGITPGELKRWMVQILRGVDACHRNSIVHRDLKPSNLLISADGTLKVADFGQARILLAPEFSNDGAHNQSNEQPSSNQETFPQPTETIPKLGGQSTCTTSDLDDLFHHSHPYEPKEGPVNGNDPLTSCVGTLWFKAPELLYGSTIYGLEIDLWSLGCIFAELLSLEPIFPGTSDINQLAKIFSIVGNLTEDVWPGCVHLPDYKIISFTKVEKPITIEACLNNRTPDEVLLVRRLLSFNPASRATAMELLLDKFWNEEPLPVPISELRVLSKHGSGNEDSSVDWNDYGDLESDSDFEEFGQTSTGNGFSIRFS